MTTLETLKSARELIAEPEHWTTKQYHRDAGGWPCEAHEATCHCAVGALWAVPQAGEWNESKELALNLLAKHLTGTMGPSEYVTLYNDSHTHAEVLALYDAAIAEVEQA